MGVAALKPKSKSSSASQRKLPSQIAAADAKANLLRMIATVEETGEYVITKRGKPVAKLVPFQREQKPDIYGCMKGTFEIVGDIMSPLPPEEWGDLY